MTDPSPPSESAPSRLERPTVKSEWTLLLAGAFCGVIALVIVAALVLHPWAVTAPNDKDRIHYLGWALFFALGGLILIVIALMMPTVGTVKASGLGADLELRGRGEAP